jgi:predicted O-methyltransferase YrrM
MDEPTLWMLIGKALSTRSINPYLDRMYDAYPGFDYYRLAYVLAKAMKPDVIVELGTQYARCTAHFAAGAPSARVLTIDNAEHLQEEELFEHDVREHYPNIELVYADSRDPELAGQFEDKSISIVFADSLHTEKHVLEEIEVWTPKIVRRGVWLIDDFRLMPRLLELLPFKVKGIVKGLHTNPIEWPDQEFGYAIVD